MSVPSLHKQLKTLASLSDHPKDRIEIESIAEDVRILTAQRDALLAACQHLIGSLSGHKMRDRTYDRQLAVKEGKAAIAAALPPDATQSPTCSGMPGPCDSEAKKP